MKKSCFTGCRTSTDRIVLAVFVAVELSQSVGLQNDAFRSSICREAGVYLEYPLDFFESLNTTFLSGGTAITSRQCEPFLRLEACIQIAFAV